MTVRISGLSTFLWGATFLAAASARGEPADQSAFQSRPNAVYGQVGVGTPLGWYGIELERTLTSHLAISGGVGMGAAGPQVALMPRLRVAGSSGSAVTFGLGASYGQYHWQDNCLFDCTTTNRDGTVAWANLEGGLERRLSNGFSARAFIGYGHIVAGHLTCTSGTFCDAENQDDGRALLYLGGAVGWAF